MKKQSQDNLLKKYYSLTKPGIIRGNLITATAGFFLASAGAINLWLLAAMLAGLGCIIAGACVFNNYMDRDIDSVMARTRERALVKGTISLRDALIFASLLGVAGAVLLSFFTNLLTVTAALVGFVSYVFLYTLSKRLSVHSTVWGSISGAMPPVVGYVAVTNKLDIVAALLFFVLVFWQMPHFYAIAVRRIKDYKKAKIPVLPIVEGLKSTKINSAIYIVGFVVACVLLGQNSILGTWYMSIATLLGCSWLVLGLRGFYTKNDPDWARNVFRYSLVVILLLCITISLDASL